MNPKERIDELTEKLNLYTETYYQEAISLVTDQEFDFLLKELETLENQFPALKRPESPTHRVGGTITKSFETIQHRIPMLSLSNTYSEQELIDWDERIQKGLLGEPYEYICEIKFDGISLSISYENGILNQALTRGDGTQGDNITANVRTIRSLPLHVKSTQFPATFEIRGEGFLPNKEFERINTEREEMGESLLANPRNAASGTFKMQDSSVVASRNLDAYVYQFLSEEDTFQTHEESLIALKAANFNVSPTWKKVNSVQSVIDYINEWSEKRHALDCATDGIVIKINSYKQREELGFTAKSPRWAIAYKYKAESKSTRLNGVTYQVGRTGAVTPVAELQPIELSQTMVRRATLHNAYEISRLGLAIGDYVFVEKAGEIIPKVTGVDTSKMNSELIRTPIEFPEKCPACGTKLHRNEGEAAFYCSNEAACPPQVRGRIEHFIQRKAMNIDSLGEGKIELLFDKGLVTNVADLYDLTYENLLGLEKIHTDEDTGKTRKVSLKEKSVQKIMEGLEESKKQPFSKVLFSLGIRFVGQTTAEKLATYFLTIEKLQEATIEELLNVPDVGGKVAESLVAFFANEANKLLIQRLQQSGIQMESKGNSIEITGNSLEGKTFLYTGTFKNYSREALEAKIATNGGKLVSGVSKKLDFLIVGESAGPSKLSKAEQLGVKMISEEEFETLLA
jgi:DNA ligase (NAD+)